MRFRYYFLFMFLSVYSCNAAAYKEDTHKVLSESALNNTYLKYYPYILNNLGLLSFAQGQVFPNPDNPSGKKVTITELVMNGADFEDRFPRSLSHFYNPVTNEAGSGGHTSPDWAIEDNGDIDPSKTDEQLYSYKDAMNYFHLALTSSIEVDRDIYWGKMFQTLGQVIHHLQDMAQPDHARNDAHCDHILCAAALALYDKSWYEEYTDGLRRDGDKAFDLLLTSYSHPVPVYSIPRDYWTTRDTDFLIENRRGIADFTNRNFVSKDTMFEFLNGSIIPNADFPYPAPLANAILNSVDIADVSMLGSRGQALCDAIKSQSIIPFPASACFLDFVSTSITGVITGESPINSRAATLSIFDKKLEDHNVDAIYTREDGSIDTIDRSFTLNKFNFDAAHRYLIPRAVAYSTGLIDHFFRGEIELTKDLAVTIPDGWQISSFLNEEMEGVFTLYYDDVNGNRKPVTGAVWDTANYGLNGVLESFGFMEVPKFTLPSDRKNGQLLLVFKGRIGQEGDRDGLNSNFVTTGYVLHLPKYRHAEIQLVSWERTQQDSTYVGHMSTTYALFVHNEIIHNFKTDVSYNYLTGVMTFLNYFVIRYLNDGTVGVVDFSSPFECYLSYSGGVVDIINNINSNPNFHCVNPIDFVSSVIEVPADNELLAIPFGYQIQNWNKGSLSRFDVPHGNSASPNYPTSTVKFAAHAGFDFPLDIWIDIGFGWGWGTSDNQTLIRFSDGSCNTLELKHVDPTWEYYDRAGIYQPDSYLTSSSILTKNSIESIIINFSKQMIMETRCNN